MKVEVSVMLISPREAVWNNLKDFASVQNYHPTVTSSTRLNDKVTGIGAERSCTFNDGNTILERIIDYYEGDHYVVDIFDMGKMPLKSAQAIVGIRMGVDGLAELFMSMEFKAKFGPLGWVMERMMMAKMFKRLMLSILNGLNAYSKTGVPVAS